MGRWLGFAFAVFLLVPGCEALAPGDGEADNDGGFDECAGTARPSGSPGGGGAGGSGGGGLVRRANSIPR